MCRERRPQGLKPAHTANVLRGPEGPLFHSGACIREFFRRLVIHSRLTLDKSYAGREVADSGRYFFRQRTQGE